MKFFDLVKRYIKDAAKRYDVKPHNVTPTQFWTMAGKDIKEWEIRKLGGYTAIRDNLFPSDEKNEIIPRSTKPKKFKLVNKKLENFTVHEAKVSDLFKELKLKDDDVLRIVVQPDSHIPEYDEEAMSVFCQFLSYYKPHGLINIGDFMEMGPVSRWEPKDAKPRRLVDDIKEGKRVLDMIGKAAGPQCVFKRFLIGNHEDWLNQYLTARVPEILDGLEDVGVNLQIQNLLGLKELGYRTIPLNEILRIGTAHFIHGYYTGVAHAKKHLDTFGCNVYYGHLHDVQSYSGVSVSGVHEAMSLGCLRTLNASFLKGRPSNWLHAFGVFEFRKDGSYTRVVPIIIDGVMSFNGKMFDGTK